MKNKLPDLTDHLFAAIERVSDETLDPDTLKQEIARASAMAGIADRILAAGKLAIDAQRAAHELGGPGYRAPSLLGLDTSR